MGKITAAPTMPRENWVRHSSLQWSYETLALLLKECGGMKGGWCENRGMFVLECNGHEVAAATLCGALFALRQKIRPL